MESLVKVFGAKALIHLRYEGDIQSLASKLSSGLIMPDFEISEREVPPHDVLGSLEVLGCELWLERTSGVPSFQYSLEMRTEHSLEESVNNQMHDLSPWLARYISSICEVEALVSGTQVVFNGGKAKPLD